MAAPRRRATGPDWFFAGLGLCVLAVAVLAFVAVTGTGPLTGRPAGLVLAFPVGVVVMIFGVVKTLRDRR